jgi:hypothetical protein
MEFRASKNFASLTTCPALFASLATKRRQRGNTFAPFAGPFEMNPNLLPRNWFERGGYWYDFENGFWTVYNRNGTPILKDEFLDELAKKLYWRAVKRCQPKKKN